MKRTFTLLALVALTLSVLAQSPDLMSYQAVLRDAQDHLLQNQAVAVQISILQGAPNGTAVYTEVHSLNTNDNGLISLMIGDGVTSDDFSTIDWGAGPYYIKTETDPAGGTNYTITSTTQLVSVPYAKYAGEAGNGFSGDYGDLADAPWALNGSNVYYNGGSVGIGTNSPARLFTVNSGADPNYSAWQNTATGALVNDGFLVGVDNALQGYVWNWENAPLQFGTNNIFRMTITGAGNVGIGTQTPVAKLDVVGTTKLGASGIDFSGIRELTATTGTGHVTNFTMPTGLTQDNVRVLSCEINFGGSYWVGLGAHFRPPGTDVYNVSYLLLGSTFYVYYPDEADYHSRAVRIIVMVMP